MLVPIILSLLAAPGGADAPRKKASLDPDRMICKYSDEPGSRLQRRKVCATASEWAERKRLEMQNLLEKQRNGAQ